MSDCDLCGRDRPTETLGFDHRREPTEEDFWRVARVCGPCRRARLMPALRRLFRDGGLNLEPAEGGDEWETVRPREESAVFFSFETEAGTTHAAREAERHASSPATWRVEAVCGISAPVTPEPRSRALPRHGEGIVTCGRCESISPMFFRGEP